MKKYQSPKSGIIGYDISPESILIEFKGGTKYLYDYKTTGKEIVENMKILAINGTGLHSYILKNAKSKHVKK